MGPNKEWRARQQVLTWGRGRGGERPLGTLLSSLGLLLQIHEFQDLSGSDTQMWLPWTSGFMGVECGIWYVLGQEIKEIYASYFHPFVRSVNISQASAEGQHHSEPQGSGRHTLTRHLECPPPSEMSQLCLTLCTTSGHPSETPWTLSFVLAVPSCATEE